MRRFARLANKLRVLVNNLKIGEFERSNGSSIPQGLDTGQGEVVQGDLTHGVHANWLTVDRIVSQRKTPGTLETPES